MEIIMLSDERRLNKVALYLQLDSINRNKQQSRYIFLIFCTGYYKLTYSLSL